MKKEEEVPIKNLVDFAIDSAILRVDNEKNPVVDRNRLKMVLIEVFKIMVKVACCIRVVHFLYCM